jgi:putative ABC transport system permease protein
MIKRFFILILKSLKHRPVRSWLTVLGIVIGTMLVVTILSLSSGIKNAVTEALQMFGSDLIMIFPGEETNPLVGFLGGQKFKEKDLMALERINGVKFVVPMEVAMLNVDFKGEKKSVMVHAAPWKGMIETFETSKGVRLEQGDWPQSDQDKETIMGYLAFNKLFKNKIRVGDELVIKSKRIKVKGFISPIGNQMDDNVIYVSLNIFRDLTGSRGGAGSAFVKVAPGADVNLIAEQIKFQLKKQDAVREFSVLSPEKANRLVGNVLAIIELVLIVIGLISLVVGAVGVMNTMYTSVLERVKQIGVMKAIGATKEAILALFLIESGMIGLIGGILGVVFGIVLAYVIGMIAAHFGVRGLFSFSSLDFLGFLVVLIITFIAGVISGILPARHAAMMEPAEALRYE